MKCKLSVLPLVLCAFPLACTPPLDTDAGPSGVDAAPVDAGVPDVVGIDVIGSPDVVGADVLPNDASIADAVINDVTLVDAGPADVQAADVAPLPARLVINEVMARNNTVLGDEAGEFDDWIEIANLGESSASLDGLTLTDEGLTPTDFTFPNDTTLAPGAFLILFADQDLEQGPLHLPFRLSSGGETLALREGEQELDRFSFGALAIDQAAGRVPGSDEVVVLETPTPGAPNSQAFTPDGEPALDVVINEFVASNATGLSDELGEFDDWIELYNAGDAPQDLSGHHLSDRADAPFLYTLPGGTILAPGGYLIIFADGTPAEGPFHAGFSLSANGESLIFSAPDGEPIDSVDFIAQLSDEASARVPNGSGNFTPQTPTPAAAND